MARKHSSLEGRLFYLRTQPSTNKRTKMPQGRGFPAVCVATQIVAPEEGSIRLQVTYATSTYNLADLRPRYDVNRFVVEPSLPFSRKEARNKARGRLNSPNHCRQLTIALTESPAHVKEEICKDIIAHSKSEIARECAALWISQNQPPTPIIDKDWIAPAKSQPEHNLQPTESISDEGATAVEEQEWRNEEREPQPGIDYGIPIDHAPTELELSTSALNIPHGQPIEPTNISVEGGPCEHTQTFPINIEHPISAGDFMDRVFGPFEVEKREGEPENQ